MKKLTKAISILLCLAVIVTMLATTVMAASVGDFKDVAEKDWFYNDVNYVVENGLFNGTSATTFSPKQGMDRAMIAAVLYRLAGSPETKPIEDFKDVPAKAYYATAVAWAKGAGVVNGTAKDAFSPADSVTREQIVSMLYRFYTVYKGVGATDAKELTAFTDAAAVSAYAADAMKWAVGNGLINGKSTDTLDPKGTAQRCEVAAMIARFAAFMEKARRDDIRIVCLAPSMVEVVYALGYGESIVGWSAYTDYPVAATQTGGYQPYQYYYAGGKNIFTDGKGYINLYELYGEEAFAEIVKRDPQVIMSPYWPGAFDYEVTTIYEIMTRPGFDQTEAVKTGRVCYYDSSLMKRFGPRTITAIEKLAYLLHPYYFKNPENSVSPWELGKIDVAENFPAPLN